MTDRELVHQALDMLKQAKDSVTDWGAYASNYFQHKHNLQRSIDDIQAQITVLSERLAQPEQALEPVAQRDELRDRLGSMTDREIMQQALEALELAYAGADAITVHGKAITALRESLAQPKQESVAEVKLMMTGGNAGIATRIVEIDDPMRERLRPGDKLYTAPQPRQWRELTDEQADSIINGMRTCLHLDSKRMFLKTWLRDWAAHGIKGDA